MEFTIQPITYTRSSHYDFDVALINITFFFGKTLSLSYKKIIVHINLLEKKKIWNAQKYNEEGYNKEVEGHGLHILSDSGD